VACRLGLSSRSPPVPAQRMGGSIFRLGRLGSGSTLVHLLLFTAAAAACGKPSPAGGQLRLVDDAGDTVSLKAAARRVVSLIPASTELLFAIGAGSSVVGRTQYCDYPPAAQQVPNLGDGIKPSMEAVLAQRPDLVILYNSGQNATVAGRLGELGVAHIRLNTDRLSDVDRVSRMLGLLTGHRREADSLIAVFDTALAHSSVSSGALRPKVLLLVWEQPPMTIGRGSFLSELIERAGGENLFADIRASSGVVSIEAVAARDPDLILTSSEGPAAFASRPEWQVVRAVRERRFLHVSGSEFNRPTPRAPDAISRLAREIREATR
jgi:iron complex transport system substrate-binding protein